MSGLINLDLIAGAKAKLKYARLSASKARVVLNLIRDEDLGLARDRLRFCERGAAEVVSKVLESAVANATNNEQLDAEELYVAECWADEGPVIKRWRPRARGRATRIFKQTCHITVIVAQLSTEELEMRETRLAASGSQTAAAARAARVAASRAAGPASDTPAQEPAEAAAEASTQTSAADAVADTDAVADADATSADDADAAAATEAAAATADAAATDADATDAGATSGSDAGSDATSGLNPEEEESK